MTLLSTMEYLGGGVRSDSGLNAFPPVCFVYLHDLLWQQFAPLDKHSDPSSQPVCLSFWAHSNPTGHFGPGKWHGEGGLCSHYILWNKGAKHLSWVHMNTYNIIHYLDTY